MTERLHLSPRRRAQIEALLGEHLPGVEVWAYGSRVNGRSHDGSDLDLALRGPGLEEIQADRLAGFVDALRDSTIPFLVEAHDWARLPESFHLEIQREHVVLVEREEQDVTSDWRETVYGRFSSDFVEDCLVDLCDQINGVQTGPFGSQLHKRDYVSVGTPIITVEHLGDNRILHEDTPQVSDHDRERLSKYILRDGDIVFSRVGSVDRRSLVKKAESGWLFSGRCLRVRPDPNKIDSGYLSYFFGLPSFKEHIRAIAVGATMPSLNTQILSDIAVPHPRGLNEQHAIAHILGTLDDKIELNRRRNETLEAMARALFKSWFVDFDPVRAKMEGRDPGLPQDLADLFPDRLVDSELGEIPEGWGVRTLGDLCHKPQYGYTVSAKSEPVGPRFLRITDINKEPWVSWSRVPYCEATDDELLKYRLRKGEVLIARMADPGHGVLVEEDVEAIFASYLIRFKPIENHHARLLQYWIKSKAYWQLVKGQAAGTTRVSLNAKVLSLFPLVVPRGAVASAFAAVVTALRDRLVKSATEMQLLAALRDTLLPKLISGEIRVRDVDKQAGATI